MNGEKEDDLMADLAEAFGEAPAEELTDEPKEAVDEAPAEEESPDDQVDETVEEVDEQAAEDAPKVAAPEDWDEDDRALFDALPDDVQRQFLLDRTRQAAEQATTQVSEKYQDYETVKQVNAELDEVFRPYDQRMQLHGMSRPQAVQRLLAAQDYLERNPSEAIQWLAQEYNVDLSQVGQTGSPADPEVAALKSKIMQLENSTNLTASQMQQARQDAVRQTIEAFKAEVDETGAAKHPHFDLLMPHMSQLLQTGKANDLHDAYAQSASMVPQQPAPKLSIEQKREAVAKAKDASKRIVSGGKAQPSPVASGSISDDLTAAWDATT